MFKFCQEIEVKITTRYLTQMMKSGGDCNMFAKYR